MIRMAWLALILPAAVCDNSKAPVTNTEVPTPGTTGDPTRNGTLDCGDELPVPMPGQYELPECVVEEIGCGEIIQGTNVGSNTLTQAPGISPLAGGITGALGGASLGAGAGSLTDLFSPSAGALGGGLLGGLAGLFA